MLENQINFIKHDIIEEIKHRKPSINKEGMTGYQKSEIQLVRESLPIFSFKDNLLQAIRDNQVNFNKKDNCFGRRDRFWENHTITPISK